MNKRSNLITSVVGIMLLTCIVNVNAGVVTDGLVSWWKFDEGAGSNAKDETAQGNDGTITGALWTTDTAGPASSHALLFDGVDDFVDFGSDAGGITGPLTIDAWFNYGTGTSRGGILDQYGPHNTGFWIGAESGTGNIRFDVYDPKSTQADNWDTLRTRNVNFLDEKWHHIAGVFFADTSMRLKIYVDGTEVDGWRGAGTAQDQITYGRKSGLVYIDTPNLSAGVSRDGFQYFSGAIDDLRLYDRALNLEEIKQNLAAMAGGSSLASDFDGDGDVDGNDFLAWQESFPTLSGASKSDGDADGDGDVDGNDFLAWQEQFPSPAALSATQEPASLVILGLGAMLMIRRQQRDKKMMG